MHKLGVQQFHCGMNTFLAFSGILHYTRAQKYIWSYLYLDSINKVDSIVVVYKSRSTWEILLCAQNFVEAAHRMRLLWCWGKATWAQKLTTPRSCEQVCRGGKEVSKYTMCSHYFIFTWTQGYTTFGVIFCYSSVCLRAFLGNLVKI